MPKRSNPLDVFKKIESFGYIVLSNGDEYKNKNSGISIRDSDGYKYLISYKRFIKSMSVGMTFERFYLGNPYTLENIILWIEKERKPFSFVSGFYSGVSDKTLTLICHKCGHNWVACWNTMKNGHECPNLQCSFPRTLKSRRATLVSKGGSLYSKFPGLMTEWDYENNTDISPSEISTQSHVSVGWICSSCGHSWKSTIAGRTSRGRGCPKCAFSGGEKRISKYLNGKRINNIPQYRTDDCRRKRSLPFDFWLPDYNILIEYHGQQHYRPNNYFGGQEAFEYRKQNDKIKKSYCKKNKINLLVIPYWDYDRIEEILENTFRKP